MRGYLARRIGQLALTLVGVSILIFLLVRLLPGDVVDATSGEPGGDPAAREALREALGLNDPLWAQYGNWIGGFFTGDPGESLRSGEPLMTLLSRALPITLEIVILGVIIALAIGVPLGILSAVKPNSLTDYAGRLFGMIGISLPGFWLATLVVLFTSSVFGWVPSTTFISPLEDPIGNLQQMILPAVCVSVYMMALVMRMLRATMLEVLGEDYVRTARAKGVSSRGVVLGHALRNALLPVITITAFEVGVMLAGTALIEVVFGMPGLGNLLVQGIFNRDYTVVQTVTLLLAATFVTMNLLADLLYAVVDPRVKLA
jgi:peptide/nickel transport system permease protein